MFNKASDIKKKYKQHAENQAYVTDVNAASLYGASIQSHLILWVSFSFIIIALIWANFAELDEVTRGLGKTTRNINYQP